MIGSPLASILPAQCRNKNTLVPLRGGQVDWPFKRIIGCLHLRDRSLENLHETNVLPPTLLGLPRGWGSAHNWPKAYKINYFSPTPSDFKCCASLSCRLSTVTTHSLWSPLRLPFRQLNNIMHTGTTDLLHSPLGRGDWNNQLAYLTIHKYFLFPFPVALLSCVARFSTTT